MPDSLRRILIIDDEVNLQKVLQHALERAGFKVDAIGDSVEALSRLTEQTYDLILCDIQMPGLSGPELFRQLEEYDPGLKNRILFMTGDTVTPNTQRFIKESQTTCLVKPFSLAVLNRFVKEMMDQNTE